jgi:hypothetical protein
MIYCVWYPSGGFGHFINAVLTLHGKNFVKPDNVSLVIGANGHSHHLKLAVPIYFKDQPYKFTFNPELNYSVLIDNGIDNETKNFLALFPGAKIIKMCYSDHSWPIVAKTLIIKAMESTFETELAVDHNWPTQESWAVREKYFLFLRDHYLRYKWKSDPLVNCIDVIHLCNYNALEREFEQIGIELKNFALDWNQWYTGNYGEYILPTAIATTVLNCVKTNITMDLTQITDIWTQSVILFYLWLEYRVEIPYNDYKEFFKDSQELSTCIHY